MKSVLLILLSAILFAACSDNDDQDTWPSYTLTVGDTTITIPAAATEYAGTASQANHFSWQAYMLREYQVATSPSVPRHGGSPYNGALLEWEALPWSVRQTFLVSPYEHDITSSPEQFYYLIGTYGEQFGYGWVDTFDPEANLWNVAGRPWLNPADSTLAPDNSGTLGFDGGLGDMLDYRALWEME